MLSHIIPLQKQTKKRGTSRKTPPTTVDCGATRQNTTTKLFSSTPLRLLHRLLSAVHGVLSNSNDATAGTTSLPLHPAPSRCSYVTPHVTIATTAVATAADAAGAAAAAAEPKREHSSSNANTTPKLLCRHPIGKGSSSANPEVREGSEARAGKVKADLLNSIE